MPDRNDRKDADNFIGKFPLLWLDKNVDSKENQKTLEKYKDALKDFEIYKANSVEMGYEILSFKRLEFRLVHVILAGSIAASFLSEYEIRMKDLKVITGNIIYCFKGDFHKSKIYAEDLFYDPGGVVTKFKEVVNYLQENQTKWDFNKTFSKGMTSFTKDLPWKNSFYTTFCNDLGRLALPALLSKVISPEMIGEKDMENFEHFIDQYNDRILYYLVHPSQQKEITLPLNLYAKNYVKLYTAQSGFYGDLNKRLCFGDFEQYRTFIIILYYGLSQKYLRSYSEGKLFRGTYISKEELNSIYERFEEAQKNKGENKISTAILTAKAFLSFSKEEAISDKFIKNDPPSPTLSKLKFIVNEMDKDVKNLFVSNIEVEDYSRFQNEKEVLFLPFSSFEIERIEKPEDSGREYPVIYLSYLNKYERPLQDYVDANLKTTNKEKASEFINTMKESSPELFKIIGNDFTKSLNTNAENSKKVIIVDPFACCKKYKQHLEENKSDLVGFSVDLATRVDQAFYLLEKYEFKMVYVIISYRLVNEFYKEFNEKIEFLGLITCNIIFCEDNAEYKLPQYLLNDKFLNPSGKLFKDFKEIIQYLKLDETGFNKRQENSDNYENRLYGYMNNGDFFMKVDSGDKLISKKKEFSFTKEIKEEDIQKFKEYVYQYEDPSFNALVCPSLEKNIQIPPALYARFFIRLYQIEKCFQSDISKIISNKHHFDVYKTYFDILKLGIAKQILINFQGEIFLGTTLNNDEYELLNSPNKRFCLLTFKTFYKKEDIANEKFKEMITKYPDTYNVKFHVEMPSSDTFISNIDIRHYGGIDEGIVNCLPFSSFEVIKIEDKKIEVNGYERDYKLIHLKCIGFVEKE